MITRPDWLRRPNADEVAQYYPPRASDLGKEGSAQITCTVTAKGTVENCMIDSETPDGLGFGSAALKLSRLFKMKPQTQDGQPVEGAKVTIPLSFKLAG